MKTSTIAILVFALGLFLTAIAWPQTIGGVYVGVDLDKVGQGPILKPDGKPDNHITISNAKSITVSKTTITDDGVGVWQHPYNGMNWEIDVEQSGTTVDLWFSVFQPAKSFKVTLTYADSTIDQVTVPVTTIVPSGNLLGQVPVTVAQTLCGANYVNSDASMTISYWADVAPCVTMANTPLLKVTVLPGGTICAQRQAVGVSNFDIWLSKVVPCVHP